MNNQGQRMGHLHILRGVASVAVAYFHLSGNSGLTEQFAATGQYGYLGVESFFVLSGFIIPYSLYKINYDIGKFFNFIIKRTLRISPPYICTIILGLCLMIITKQELPPLAAIIANGIYIAPFIGYNWISPVFWTLGIEFQFYIFIGLLYPFYIHTSNIQYTILTILLLIIPPFITNPNSLFHWMTLFTFGTLTFKKMFFKMNGYLFIALMLVTFLTSIITSGVLEAIVGLLTVLFIVYFKMNSSNFFSNLFLGLGTISYSLYLTHWEVGRLSVALTRHIPILGNFEVIRVILGLLVAVICACFFYLTIERKALILAKNFKYRSIANH